MPDPWAEVGTGWCKRAITPLAAGAVLAVVLPYTCLWCFPAPVLGVSLHPLIFSSLVPWNQEGEISEEGFVRHHLPFPAAAAFKP